MHSFKYEIHGNTYDVTIDSFENNVARVIVNGVTYDVEVKREKRSVKIERPKVTAGAGPQPERMKPQGKTGDVNSPLPGVIKAINVKDGDEVKQGQTLCILEAMKMDNEIAAPHAGKVAKVHVTEGKSVLEGETLISIGG